MTGYDAESLRELIERFDHPAGVHRDDRVLMVNAAYLARTGFTPAQVEGRPVEELICPEERLRFLEHKAAAGAPPRPPLPALSVLLLTADGRRLGFHCLAAVFPAADGGSPYVLASCFELPEHRAELQSGERLVDVAARLARKRSEAEVRSATVEGFARFGLTAAFFELDGEELEPCCPEQTVPAARVAYAQVALGELRPVFEGGALVAGDAERVYLPIAQAEAPTVLVLSGPGLSSREVSALALFSRQVSSALANARLISDLERRNQEQRLLLELARTTATTLEPGEILDIACDFLVKLLDVSNCFILLHDERAKALRGAAASATHRELVRTLNVPLDARPSLAATVARERRPVAVEDLALEPDRADPELVRRFGEKALIGLPLTFRDQLIGVVMLDDTRSPRRFSPELIELAQATAGQLALSIFNAQLFQSLKESYAELAETRAEMVRRERLAALGELAAIVAHEVRNPLAVIFNAVSSLRRQPSPGASSTLLLDIVTEESDRLNRIVGDLLDFARPRAAALEPEQLEPVLKDAIEVVRPQAASERGGGAEAVRFSLAVEPSLPPVRMDRRMIRQALVNVLLNAAQAMPRGGEVRVHARKERQGERSWLRVEVADQGPGIPPELAHRLFEPFFTTKAKGTGLGLAVVKRIVEEHDGRVEVTTDLGRGTTFVFRFAIDLEPLAPPVPTGARLR